MPDQFDSPSIPRTALNISMPAGAKEPGSAKASSIPAGWKLVPIEPTGEMELGGLLAFIRHLERYDAGHKALAEQYKDDPEAKAAIAYMDIGAKLRNGAEMVAVYAAMLAAAPEAPLATEVTAPGDVHDTPA